ncbi:MAG: carotenoid 1,2-hydratase [Anaerolineae bacterium]|nr:carotenoid 1,2-hydratase [Anaerolineae bacterium]
MWRWILLALIAISIVVFGFSLIDSTAGDTVNANTQFDSVADDTSLYKRAVDPWNWEFPKDFGAHPEFQTEWWYYTGNIEDADGRRFGYQFTIFRRAILPESFDTTSEWRTDQVYMAHFAVSDIEGGQYYHEQRFSRGGADLAGATADPLYHVWLEDWQIIAEDDQAAQTRISANAESFAVDLTLEQTKPPALQGQNGLSPKSAEPGNASYYYSLSRLLTEGTIRVGDQTFTVTGTTWKDHEFSTSALGTNALGWDWFGLQLDDDRELMLGQIRLNDGEREPAFGGLLVNPDGTTRYLKSTDFTFEVTGTWQSPHTGATYPAGWNITIDTGDDAPLNLTVTPLLADQELHGSGGTDYWEGAVQIGGDVTGYGYAELTGYVQAMTGRF